MISYRDYSMQICTYRIIDACWRLHDIYFIYCKHYEQCVTLCPPHTSRRDETKRFLLVCVSRVSSRRLVCGVSKTSFCSSVVDFGSILRGHQICLVFTSFVALVDVRGPCRRLKTTKKTSTNWTPHTSRRKLHC